MNVSVLVSITRVSAPFPRRSDASSSPVLRLVQIQILLNARKKSLK